MTHIGERTRGIRPTRFDGGKGSGMKKAVTGFLGPLSGFVAGIAPFDHDPGIRTSAHHPGGHVRRYRIHRGRAVPAPPKATAMPLKTSVPVRVARIIYAVLSSLFVACVLVQVFLAGMGAFGANWTWHLNFVHLFGALPLLMIPMAFAGRMSWGLRLLPFGLVVLVGVQYATANSAVPAAALHPVNALLIFLVSMVTARRAWATVAGRR